MHLRITTALAALALFAAVSTAKAQDPEAGDTGQWQQPQNGQQGGWGQQGQGQGNNGQPPQGGWQNGQNNGQQGQGQGQPPPGGWQNGQNNGQQTGNGQGGWAQDNEHAGGPHGQAGETPAEAAGESGQWTAADNHAGALHHLGVGFFGVVNVPVADDPAATTGSPFVTVAAPTVGVRYWINDLLAFEGALGIGYQNGSGYRGTLSTRAGSVFGIAFHVGLPLALAHWKHFAFILEPEVELGIGGGDDGGNNSFSGFLFRIGGRIGAEIHMGFIGIPQLSLQAGVGLHLAFQSGSTTNLMDASGNSDHGVSGLAIGTSIEKNPWDWFTGNITAIYYL